MMVVASFDRDDDDDDDDDHASSSIESVVWVGRRPERIEFWFVVVVVVLMKIRSSQRYGPDRSNRLRSWYVKIDIR
jgi:hypothetical protein